MKALLLLALVACSDHPGTYFEVHGGAIEFDHVEFFFGKAAGDGTFGAPGQAHAEGSTYERQLADTDLAVAAKHGTDTDLTYYVPYTTENSKLGDYAVAVASLAGQPVGIADASSFEIEASGFGVVGLQLEPYDASVTQWNACIAWTRSGGRGAIGIVPTDDRDCDGQPSPRDCDDTAYCLPFDASCQPASTIAKHDGECVSGCTNRDGDFIVKDCLFAVACDPTVCPDVPLSSMADRFACLETVLSAHYSIYIPLDAGGQPCRLTVPIPLPGECHDPAIEVLSLQGGWGITAAESATTPGTCEATLVPSTPLTPYPQYPHFLLSFVGADPSAPRSTVYTSVERPSLMEACTIMNTSTGSSEITTCE